MKPLRSFLVILLACVAVIGAEGCRVLAPAPTATRTRARAVTPTRLPRPTFTPFRTNTPAPPPTQAPATTPAQPTKESPPTKIVAPRATALSAATPVPPRETFTPAPPPQLSQPPREGGSWDFENGFFSRASGFEGRVDYIGVEWNYFRHRGENGQGTFNENKNQANVHRGARSQEIAFESSDGDAGILRTIDVIPGHRYVISAWGIHFPSPSPIELDVGIDLSGGLDSRADTVEWYPWRETGEGKWLYTEETLQATGSQMTIYLRVTHRVAAPGGATLLDDVRVMDRGEE